MNLRSLLGIKRGYDGLFVKDDYSMSVKFDNDIGCYVWCDKSGDTVLDSQDVTGKKRVILSDKLLFSKDWYFVEREELTKVGFMEAVRSNKRFIYSHPKHGTGKAYVELDRLFGHLDFNYNDAEIRELLLGDYWVVEEGN